MFLLFFFFNDTATTEIYTLSLHDALPISRLMTRKASSSGCEGGRCGSSSGTLICKNASLILMVSRGKTRDTIKIRSEEHTSELQSRLHLVCRLLLEKKKK